MRWQTFRVVLSSLSVFLGGLMYHTALWLLGVSIAMMGVAAMLLHEKQHRVAARNLYATVDLAVRGSRREPEPKGS